MILLPGLIHQGVMDIITIWLSNCSFTKFRNVVFPLPHADVMASDLEQVSVSNDIISRAKFLTNDSRKRQSSFNFNLGASCIYVLFCPDESDLCDLLLYLNNAMMDSIIISPIKTSI